MSISKSQIFNITLNILGVSMPLENAQSDDNRSILLNNYYELARDYVLKDFDWNFASVYRKLSLSLEEDNSEFQYCYDYPNDCISARNLFNCDFSKSEKFVVSSSQSGSRIILTNISDAVLRYTRRVDKEIYFSPEFSIALSYYLASLTSNVITGSLQKGEMAYEKYQKLLRRAKVMNAYEGEEVINNDETYLDSRY